MNDVIRWLKTPEGIAWERDAFEDVSIYIAYVCDQPEFAGDAASWPHPNDLWRL